MQYKSDIELIKDIKAGVVHPVYVLYGEEAYYIDKVADYVQNNLLDEASKEFDQQVLYGDAVSAEQVVDAANQFPMMSQRQLIIYREAQLAKNLEALAHYIAKPLASTILVIVYRKKLDKRSKFYKALKKDGALLESEKLPDYKVKDWISSYVKEQGYALDLRSAELLADFLGNDLAKVANEVQKLVLTLPQGKKTITAEHIEENIGISKDFNNFELKDAIAQKNVLKANRIIDYFSKNPTKNPLTLSLAVLFNYFSQLMIIHYLPDKSKAGIASALRINPYFAQQYVKTAQIYSAGKVFRIIAMIRDYDARGKGVGNVSASQHELLKELVFKIIHL